MGFEAPGFNLTFTEYTPVIYNNFSVSDLKDESINRSVGGFIYSFGEGENYESKQGKTGNLYRSKSTGFGIGMKSFIPINAKYSKSKTFQKEFK